MFVTKLGEKMRRKKIFLALKKKSNDSIVEGFSLRVNDTSYLNWLDVGRLPQLRVWGPQPNGPNVVGHALTGPQP